MEQLNRVELRGTVGSVYVKDFGNTRCVNFSVATNYCFKDREGCPVIETTWHRIIVWQEQCPNLDIIQKGAQLFSVSDLDFTETCHAFPRALVAKTCPSASLRFVCSDWWSGPLVTHTPGCLFQLAVDGSFPCVSTRGCHSQLMGV